MLKRLASFVSALILAVASLFVLYTPQVQAANNGDVVFSRSTDGGATFDLFVRGTSTAQLTSGGQDIKPAWSPDGTKVAFVRQVSLNGHGNIYVINADGSNLTQLTNSAPTLDDSDPIWSPDGTKIAFTSNRTGVGGSYQIFTMNADGSNETIISNQTTSNDSGPSWSPDGTKIVFESERTGQSNIFTMNADGSSVTAVTSNSSVANYHHPVWSPDGTKILYSMNGGGSTDYGMNEINADGTGPISSLGSDAGRSYLYPTYSPDGNYILFTSKVGSAYQLMYVRSNDGGGLVNYSSNAFIEKQTSWAADSAPSIGIAGNSTATANQSVTLIATGSNCTPGAGSWTWDVDGGYGYSIDDTIVVNWSTTGVKNVTATSVDCVAAQGTKTVTIGTGAGAAACISAEDVTIDSGATYDVDLGGTTACTQYDKITASGLVQLGGTLSVNRLNNYVPAPGDSLTIIDQTNPGAILGTFVGLAEGDTVTVGGVDMIISYADGTDSNDVTLSVPFPTITVSGPATGLTGESKTFTATTSLCTPAASGWTWTTNGGTGSSTTNSIDVTWSTSGTKTVHATNSGCANAIVTDDTIAISNAPTIEVSGPSTGVTGQSLAYTAAPANCTANASGWTWSINGGTGTSNSSTINVTWSTTGSKTISATNSGCAGAGVTAETTTISTPSGGVTPSSADNPDGTKTTTVSESQNLSTFDYTVSDKETLTNDGTVGDVTVQSGATVKGHGTFGDLTVQSGGHLAPGNSPGCVNSTGLTLASGSSYDVEIEGTTACDDYDQTKVDGAVDITGATLNVQLIREFKPKKDDSFRIIDNDASETVTGTFAGLAEGATFTVDGYVFKITYVGGTGNDVVLTVQSVPSTPNTGLSILFANPLLTLLTTTILATSIYAIGNKRRMIEHIAFKKK